MNREKHNARRALHCAVKAGQIVKPERCVRCGVITPELEAHHPDYREPLKVEWVCVPCHNVVHPHPPKVFLYPKER